MCLYFDGYTPSEWEQPTAYFGSHSPQKNEADERKKLPLTTKKTQTKTNRAVDYNALGISFINLAMARAGFKPLGHCVAPGGWGQSNNVNGRGRRTDNDKQ